MPAAGRPMAKKFPIKPAHPERICWGCDKYCPADAMQCGNGTIATPHPSELFGDDWMEWGLDASKPQESAEPPDATNAEPTAT
jgi:hypothetical protein